MDIAVEASFSARATYLSARRGAYVIPKYLFGRPLDQYAASTKIPFAVRRKVMETLLRVQVGDMERYGLPKPDHRFGDAHPTISDDVLSRIAHGEIQPRPTIERLTERTVVFAGGGEVEADVVVYCTGYKVTFPFFSEDVIAAPDNDLPLFRRVFHPERRDVFFIGLVQPLGAIMPLAQVQSEWVADHLTGRYGLPGPAALRADIEAERRRMFKRYVRSKRHTLQVDYDDYLAALDRERRAGAERV
jgi:dimethylaniline monooxygenase (N-oxide forming)